MLLPHMPILRYPLPDGTLQIVVYFIFPTSRRSSTGSFLFVGFPGGDTKCPSVISYSVTYPAQVHFRHLTCSITSVTFVFSLNQKFVFLPLYVLINIFLPFFVCTAASLFCVWLVSAHVSAPYVIAGSMHEL